MKREGFFEHKCSYCDRLWSTYELLTTMSQKMVIRMLGNFKSESEVAKKLWIYSERFAVFIHFWTVWKRRTLLHPKKGTNSHKNEGSYCEEFILPRVEYNYGCHFFCFFIFCKKQKKISIFCKQKTKENKRDSALYNDTSLPKL